MVTTAFSTVSQPHLSLTRETYSTASNESPLSYSRTAHSTIGTHTLDLTLHIQYADMPPSNMAPDPEWWQWIEHDPVLTDTDPVLTDTDPVLTDTDPMLTDSELEFLKFVPIPSEVNMMTCDQLGLVINDDLQFPREQSNIQQTHFPQDLLQDSSQTFNPVSPTSTSSLYETSPVLTPQSPNQEFFLPSSPFDYSSWGDFNMTEDQSSPPVSIEQAPSPTETWGLTCNTPTSPSPISPPSPYHQQTPLTPPTPDHTLSPVITPSADVNGPGSIPKPSRKPRRPSASRVGKRLRCDFTGDGNSAPCNKEFERNCDLTKHKKRHRKDFPCRYENCTNNHGFPSEFSSEKDRERHENCIHKKNCLVCTECGHETTRKDNMKDHVLRKHGRHSVEEIMHRIMAAPKTSAKPVDNNGKGV